jgi:hypothetical protein
MERIVKATQWARTIQTSALTTGKGAKNTRKTSNNSD